MDRGKAIQLARATQRRSRAASLPTCHCCRNWRRQPIDKAAFKLLALARVPGKGAAAA